MPAGRFLTKAAMPSILALTRPSGPGIRPLEAIPVRDRRGGFEGVAAGTVANRRGPGLGQLE
ncbi:hypothetical protein MDA_GLEAN10006102 [Myotis davidii]|uniref:Uncharacterized protein n=1 Tax=Myotis davidii TaxID=225400 RepID=L5LC77_MYODS|nr:hypothetical protein MDA_GLEAN10006102 [Myotis davidii]